MYFYYIRLKYTYLFILISFVFEFIKAQCPQLYDGNGSLSSNPYWIDCNGGSYVLNLQADINFGAYNINWGDGTAVTSGTNYVTPTKITHTYTATTDTFIVMLTTNSCTVQGVVVMEKPVSAGIQIVATSSLISCAPKNMQFINASTNVSQTTHFTWNFGDGSPPASFSYSNAGSTISHVYNPGTVNCQTAVTLSAYNYCSFGSATTVNFSPIKVYEKDKAQITSSVTTRCWPDNYFSFNNSTVRNCLSFGNVNQRYEKWNFGNNWGMGHDSIINWKAWPPTSPVGVAYPAVGNYSVVLEDSSLCGIATTTFVVNIINKPVSLIASLTNTVCQGIPITFTNSSTTNQSYDWNFGKGGGFQSLPYGPQTVTYNASGNFTVSLVTYMTGFNKYCSDTSRKVINVKPKPVSNFTFSPIHGCDNSSVSFIDLSTGSINGWNWTFGNGNTSQLNVPPSQNYITVGQFTVSLITKTTDGCLDTLDKPFNVYPAPIANFTASNTCTSYITHFNNTTTNNLSDPIISYSWNFGDGSPISNSITPTHIYTVSNTYTVSLTVNTLHCTSTKTLALIVNQKPTANFVASHYTVCPNAFISFTNISLNGNTYNWLLAAGITSVSTHASNTYSNTTQSVLTNSVMLVVNTNLGCRDTSIQVIKVYPKPIANFTSSITAGCAPLKVKFKNNSIGGSSFLWNFGDGSSSTYIDTVHLFTNTTLNVLNYTVNLIATNNYGCIDSAKNAYVIYPEPIYNFAPTLTVGCSPQSVTLTTTSGGVNYLWDFDDGSFFSGTNNQTHVFVNTLAVNDTFNVKLITTNAYNCKDTAWGQVIVKPSPTSVFAASTSSGCSDLFVSFSNTSLGAIAHQWYFGDGNMSSAIIPNHTYTNTTSTPTVFPVSLVVSSSNGCKDSATKLITVYPKANYTYTVTQDTGCTVFKVPFITTPGALSYFWDFGDGNTQTAFNPTHGYSSTNSAGTTYSISMTATSPYGCKNTQASTIFVYPKPTASFTLTNTVGCSPLNSSFNNTSTGATSYLWYFGDGDTTLISSPSHIYLNNGSVSQIYVTSLVASDLNGCKDSVSVNINVYPQANYGYQVLPDSGCSGFTANFPTTPGATSYLWNFGDGQNGSGINPNHQYINTTTATVVYTVTLISTNSFGCKDTVNHLVTVFPIPKVSFIAGPITQVYPSTTVTFTNTSPTGNNYSWNLGDGTNLSTYSISPHSYATWGVYTIKLIVSTSHCADSLKQTITILPHVPIAQFVGSKKGCQPLPVSFINQSIYATNYSWNFGDGNTSSQSNPTHIFNNPGTFVVSLIAYGPGGSDTIKKIDSVVVYQKPFAFFTATPLLVYVPNDPVIFTNQSQYAVFYNWDFGDGGTSTNTNPIYNYILPGDYNVTLIATNTDGCIDTFKLETTIKAEVITGVEVPNAFTPNPSTSSNGGVFDPTALNNDIFHPILRSIKQYELFIYNKWGELLFYNTDQKVGWDGYYKGKLCEEGTYIYNITALTTDGKSINKAGDVLLIR